MYFIKDTERCEHVFAKYEILKSQSEAMSVLKCIHLIIHVQGKQNKKKNSEVLKLYSLVLRRETCSLCVNSEPVQSAQSV